jgi:hypothetical protein
MKADFVNDIETIRKNKKVDYMEAVIIWCETNNVEIETAAKMIKKDSAMKSKIQVEAEDLNFIKSGARLPV